MIVLDLSFFDNIVKYANFLLNSFFYDIETTKNSLDLIMLLMFKYWLWVVYVAVFLRYLIFPEYMYYIQVRWFTKNIQSILLAIDVPKRNEQSVQAMENFFNHLLGAHGTFTKWAKYIEGEFQLGFSCELVSIEGNIQFLIRTPKHLRNLVEAAIYGQFTDAEITEVEDYVTNVPRYFPNDTHELWGCEFSLGNKNYALPLKTWPKFEHQFSEAFVDPMAALLETMSQIGPGEQIWLQYLIKPLPVNWGKDYQKEIDAVLGKAPAAPKANLIGSTLDKSMIFASEIASQVIGSGEMGVGEEKKKEDQPFKMMNLTPGQRDSLEAMEKKISRLAFDTKIRMIYVTEKGKMNKAIGVNGVIGAIKQWNDMGANNLKPMLKETGTNSPQYIMIEKRRNTRRNYIMGAYRSRDTVMGVNAFPLCDEELASIWHFPGMNIKAPFVKTTAFKKAAAPVSLPMEAKVPEYSEPKKLEEVMAEKQTELPTFDYDNDEFEKQFALDKEAFDQSRSARAKQLEEIAKQEAQAEFVQTTEENTELAPVVEPKKTVVSAVKTEAASKSKDNEPEKAPNNLPFLD